MIRFICAVHIEKLRFFSILAILLTVQRVCERHSAHRVNIKYVTKLYSSCVSFCICSREQNHVRNNSRMIQVICTHQPRHFFRHFLQRCTSRWLSAAVLCTASESGTSRNCAAKSCIVEKKQVLY